MGQDIVFNEVSGCYENLESMPKASVGSVNLFFDGSGNSSHNKLGILIGSPKSVANNLGGTFAHEILHTLGIPDFDKDPERDEGPLSSYAKKRHPIGKTEILDILTPSLELIEENNIDNGNILIPAGKRIKATGEWKRNNPEILNP